MRKNPFLLPYIARNRKRLLVRVDADSESVRMTYRPRR